MRSNGGPSGGQTDQRGVSEVISSVLLVVVVIILAALVGTVVVDLGNTVDDDPLAGVSIDTNPSAPSITVTYAKMHEKGTTVTAEVIDQSDGSTASKSMSSVGESKQFGAAVGVDSGHTYRILITATGPNGREAVVLDTERSV